MRVILRFKKIINAIAIIAISGTCVVGQSVEAFAPATITSGDVVPVVVRILDQDGAIDKTATGDYLLRSDAFGFGNSSIKVYRGIGSLMTSVVGVSSGVIGIQGMGGEFYINLDNSPPTQNHSGTILQDEVWDASLIHVITANLTVPQGKTLTIQPGAVIKIHEDKNILVSGRILVMGSSALPVTFMSYQRNSAWGGIEIRSGNMNSEFHYAIFNDGGGDLSRVAGHSGSQPVLLAEDAALFLNDCFFIGNSGKAILTENSNNQLSDVVISRCDAGCEFRDSQTELEKVHISFLPDDDRSSIDNDNDGIYFWHYQSGNKQVSTVSDFFIHFVEDDGMDLNDGCLVELRDGFISNAYDKGFSVSMESQVTLWHTTVIESDEGVVIKDGSTGYVRHMTIFGNRDGLKLSGDVNGNGKNLIVYGNTADNIENDAGGDFPLSYSMAQNQITGTGNIAGNPMFVNPDGWDFSLSPGSPAIDAGDPNLPLDPDGTRSDIGAIPFRQAASNKLLLTELCYKPVINGISSGDYEFIELYNPTNDHIDMSGFRFISGIEFTFPDGVLLESRQYLMVAFDRSVWPNNVTNIYQWTGGSLSDTGESIELVDKNGERVMFVSYQSQNPWPRPPQYHFFSVELIDGSTNDQLPSNWQISREYGGTPGKANKRKMISELYINEIMAKNDGYITDETGNPGDWVEVVNLGISPVSLVDLYFSDNNDPFDNRMDNPDFDALTIMPGEYLVIWADDRKDMGARHLGFTLPSGGGTLFLNQRTDNTHRTLSSLIYPSLGSNLSYGRYPDGSDHFFEFDEPSPGSANVRTIQQPVSNIYINEFVSRYGDFYPDESGDYSDWIEVYNAGSSAVNLAGLYFTDNLNVPDMAKIPAGSPAQTTIQPGGYLVFHADLKSSAGPRHLDFQLAGAGEQVGLFQFINGNWRVVDSVSYGQQSVDVSWGRTYDGGMPWRYFWTPTPGSSNAATAGLSHLAMTGEGLHVYPNPFHDRMVIGLPEPVDTDSRIELLDMKGSLRATTMLSALTQSQDAMHCVFNPGNFATSSLGQGVYLLRVVSGNKIFSARVVRLSHD